MFNPCFLELVYACYFFGGHNHINDNLICFRSYRRAPHNLQFQSSVPVLTAIFKCCVFHTNAMTKWDDKGQT